MIFNTRTLLSSAMVRTSPGLTPWPGDVSRTPLMRTWPEATSSAALERAFTTRACHSHLSRRWRSDGVSDIGRSGVPRSPAAQHDAADQSFLLLEASCSLSAASLANGEFGSTGRSRSRGLALDA